MEPTIHPQVRKLVTRLCEAFNVPISSIKLQIWQEKLKTPNPDVLTETYNLLTDGRGQHHKMPTIAEFMSLYKEREKIFIQRQNLQIAEEFPQSLDKSISKQKFKEILDELTTGKPVETNLCSFPHDFKEKGQKGRITRDDQGRDWVQYF